MMTRSIRILAALASLSLAAPAIAADLCKPVDRLHPQGVSPWSPSED